MINGIKFHFFIRHDRHIQHAQHDLQDLHDLQDRRTRRDLDLDLERDLERRGRCVTPLHEDGAGFAADNIFIYQNIKINGFYFLLCFLYKK
jgi:hypothetical protein